MVERRVPAGGAWHSTHLQGPALRLILLALATLALLLFTDFPAEAATAVGTITGSFGATPTGGASYSMPLPAPGGAGGLSPNLSLDYTSGSGPGLLGWDVTVGGLSAIKRCPSTYTYDSSTAPVNLTSRDRFCLDGQEMTIKSGTYGDGGATYVTTPTAHMLVTSETGNNAIGPLYFEVQHPDGSVWEYGSTTDSRVAAKNATGTMVYRVWALDKIEDANSNTITFHYMQPSGTGAYYISEVDWGANANQGTVADHSYVFTYGTAGSNATVYRYVAGNEIVWDQRVTQIALDYKGATTLTWTTAYNGANRSPIASIKECDSGGHCLPETVFDWQFGAAGYGYAQSNSNAGPSDDKAFVADVNGDGREDLIYARSGVWRVRFGVSGGGFGVEHSTGVSVINASFGQPIHYEPGAADQILVENSSDDWAIVSWDSSNSTFSSPHDTGIAVTGPAAAADVNGDGYDDLVTYNNAQVSLVVYLHTLTNNTPGFGSAITAYTASAYDSFVGFRGIGIDGARGPSRALHFSRTGDGVVARIYHYEVICLEDGCPSGSPKRTIKNWHDQAFVWTGGALTPYGGTFSLSGTTAAGGHVFPFDINGDGLTDLMISATATLLLNTGSTLRSKAYAYSTSGLDLGEAVAVGYSGNGRNDLLVPNSSSGDWTLLPSSGTVLGASEDTGAASSHFGTQPVVADTEGRMLDDVVGVNGSGNIEFALRHGGYPDLVTRISDGLGNYHALTWEPLSDNNIVQDSGTWAAPLEFVRRGPYLLASWQADNGIGGSYTMSYDYETPLRIAGEGFHSIHQVDATDSRTGNVTKTQGNDSLFASGLPGVITVLRPNGNTIWYRSWVRTIKKSQPKLLKFSFYKQYDKNGRLLYTTEHAYNYDTSNNDALIEDKATTTDNLSGKVWTTDTTLAPASGTANGNWCFGLDSAITVTDTLPSGASAARETDYATDAAHCRITGLTKNAGASTALQTDITYKYKDGFGNVTKVDVTGHNPDGSAMTARTTTFGYDNHGEFRTQVTDAAGDNTKASWNGAFGVKRSATAANGSVTRYAYDGFGRLAQVTLPTGAYSTLHYATCTNYCTRWDYYVRTWSYDASGSAGKQWDYYDRYGRKYEHAVERQGGGVARSVTIYNALGQVQKQSAPYYSGDTVYWTQYDYDALGRVHEIVAPNSTSGTTTTTISYSGYTATVSGPGGYTRTVTKNPLGQVTQVTNADGKTSSYAYAPFAELTQVTGPDTATTTLQYDAAGHRTQLGGPDRGTLRFQFNSLGAPVSETNARGQAISMGDDTLGRMTQRSFPNPSGSGTEIQQWHYAASGNGTGRLVSESDNETGFSRTLGNYNVLGEPRTLQETFDGVVQTLTLGYDSLGRITSVTYPVSVGGHALQVDYHYDTSGNLDEVSNANDGTVYWQPQSTGGFPAMNALGQMQAYTLGGGLDVERLHDAATGAVTSITSGPSGSGSVLNLTTGYNASESRATLNDLDTGLDESYSYDHFQRLLGVTRTAAAGNSSSSFSYYAAGQFNQGPAGSYSYAGSPVAHSPSSTVKGGVTTNYSYNADGDRTAARLPQVIWDALGKARSVTPQSGATPIELTYGPDGGLVNTTSAEGGRYLGAWLKWQDSNDWSARIIVNGQVIAVVKDSAGSVSTAYLLQGPLGSTRALATGAGSLTQRIAYGAWGRFVHPDTGTGSSTVNVSAIAQATTVTYTGHELIAGAGLINMGARLYDPATGLFMSPDPTVAHPYDTQDLNQYAYVGDNPETFVDPNGLKYDCGDNCVDCPKGAPPSAGCAPCLTCIGNDLALGILGLSIGGGGPGGGGAGGGGNGGTQDQQSKKGPCGKDSSSTSSGNAPSPERGPNALPFVGGGAAAGATVTGLTMSGYLLYIGTTETTIGGLAAALDAGLGGFAVGGPPGAVIGAAGGAMAYGGYLLYEKFKPGYQSVMKNYQPEQNNQRPSCRNNL